MNGRGGNAIIQTAMDTFRLNIISQFQTGNYVFDMLITTCIFGFITMVVNLICNFRVAPRSIFSAVDEVLFKKRTITIEGRRCIKSGAYAMRTDQLFSNRFRALWHYIGAHINTHPSIVSIKEYAESANSHTTYGDKITSQKHQEHQDIYVVKQNRSFVLTKDIFCNVLFNNEDLGEGTKTVCKIETISLHIYSYKKTLAELQEFIDGVTKKFMVNIETCRWNNFYIYSLMGPSADDHHEHNLSCWEECPFKSNRTFDNLFFDNKNVLMEKLLFFENNRAWYEAEGHPYTLGVALHGPPGTGKTSVIKCMANMLKRHLIVIPLNKIKTQRDFSKYYFESQYNKNNRAGSIDFDKKIIVLDDIDCMSDLVKCRSDVTPEKGDEAPLTLEIMKTISDIVSKDHNENNTDVLKHLLSKEDDNITLAFLLNIIDGIRETPGRILIITSNYYNHIDEALRRPGRIDFPLEMKNASVATICEMYKHYYGKDLPKECLNCLKDGVLSPAQIVNIRLQTGDCDKFVEILISKFI